MTVTRVAGRPIYLAGRSGPVFGLFHEPDDDAPRSAAVLICGPWGWDDIASYRSRKAWAESLAEHGHPTLRIDLPGSGDSGGSPDDPSLVESWLAAIITAARWLAEGPDAPPVCLIGLGLGGLIGAAAISGGAPVDDLVLWAVPATGRAFVREQRAFAALQGTRMDPARDGGSSIPSSGDLEVSGFVLSAGSMNDLNELVPARLDLGRLRRALLLERDGMGHDQATEAHLRSLEVEVTVAPGRGWADMVFHPEHDAPPSAVFAEVEAWLDSGTRQPGTGRSEQATLEQPGANGTAVFGGTEARIRETPVRIDHPNSRPFGVLAEPIDGARSDLCAVFLNAGAVRRIGPNRMWVEAARQWSGRGIPTLRIDLNGIGDADGEPVRRGEVGNFYKEIFASQMGAAFDFLVERGHGPRFVLVGLCSGAYWSINVAAHDSRVVEVIAINPRAVVWDDDLLARREARKVQRLG